MFMCRGAVEPLSSACHGLLRTVKLSSGRAGVSFREVIQSPLTVFGSLGVDSRFGCKVLLVVPAAKAVMYLLVPKEGLALP